MLGRLLAPADDRPGGGTDGPVVVISYRFWQLRFNGAADVVGRTLTLDGTPFTIVGVMPEGFFGPSVGARYSLAAPLATQPLLGPANFLTNPVASWLAVMARLKPGQTAAAATAALQATQPAIRDTTLPPHYPPQAVAGYLKDPLVVRPAPAGSTLRCASSIRSRCSR